MERQVENLSHNFNEHDITVVVGFKKDLIMERFPELTYVYNPFFDRTNTSKTNEETPAIDSKDHGKSEEPESISPSNTQSKKDTAQSDEEKNRSN